MSSPSAGLDGPQYALTYDVVEAATGRFLLRVPQTRLPGAQVAIYARDMLPDTRSARATGSWTPDSSRRRVIRHLRPKSAVRRLSRP